MTTTSRPADAALGRALALVRDLRARCSWDAAQTPETLRPYLVEEALELDQAIRTGDARETTDELGDLLLQLAFHIVIGEERGLHDAEAVTQGLERKMWRRHPHLFGDGAKPESWEGIKRREQGAGTSTLRGLPATLPPLLMAYRLQERAAGVGFDWPDAQGPLTKVKEETAELERETGTGKREAIEDELGDLLFAVVNLARKLGVEPGQALEKANDKFTRRFGAVEQLAAQRGIELGRAKLEDLDRLWDEVKARS
ncbi:MAG TPA: nucleoside triphosphate pyrophosphohydrolase [Gemmatimonadales bacterium]|nr:nucleoside triphosphate pyrophosphohydrolase [Gemmatimonadales bacterium]